MNQRKLFTLSTATLAALVIGFGTTGRVEAQQSGGLSRTMKGFGRMIDPAASSKRILIKRDDVKSEIYLSQRQAEQLQDAEIKAQADIRQKAQDNRVDIKGLQNLSEDERKAKMDEMRTKMADARQSNEASLSSEIDKKAEAILKADQKKRLTELDLQWRGPMALADPKVAEQFKLTAEQKPKVLAILSEYKKSQGEMFNAAFSALKPDPNAAGTPQRPDPAAIEAKMVEMQEKLEKIRDEQGEKVLALLDENQKAAWTAALGKKFAFRKNE